MGYEGALPQRRSIRLEDYDYSAGGCYFVTICCHSRQRIWGSIDVTTETVILSQRGEIAQRCLEEIPRKFPGASASLWMVMPDHIHAIIHISQIPLNDAVGDNPASPSLSRIVGWYKSTVYRRCMTAGLWDGKRQGPMWQRNYYEHIIRGWETHSMLAEYILSNPARWVVAKK